MAEILVQFAKQWIAGEKLEDAIEVTKLANQKHISIMLNKVGEHYKEEQGSEIDKAVDEYIRVLNQIKKEKLDASISVKPTQLGIMVDIVLFRNNLLKIAKEADKLNLFVWIDMEGLEYCSDTIEAYKDLHRFYKNIGICLQANLLRTWTDIEDLVEEQAWIRLVKGAYHEPGLFSLTEYDEINERYIKLMTFLFQFSHNFAIGTHDSRIIAKAIKLHQKYPKAKFEFQMLRGVRGDLKEKLIKKGYHVSEYVPYGKEWIPYAIRRLIERKRNILLILESLREHQ